MEQLQPRRRHLSKAGQFSDLLDVDRAPNAFLLARCETDFIALIVDAFSDAVDPANAQGNVDRFRPRDAVAPRTFLRYPSQTSVAFGLFLIHASKASWLVKKTAFSICHVPLSLRH